VAGYRAPSPLPAGKLPAGVLRSLLTAGAPLPPEVRVPPAIGEDGCAIDVDAGTVIVATDPITLTGSDVGAHAVVINANDVAVMGARPRWFLAVILLAPGSSEDDVTALFAGIRAALARVGASLVGGHTEVSAVVNQSIVVGQMIGWCPRGAEVRTSGMQAGDSVLQIGRAPVEGAAVLAGAFRAEVHEPIDAELLRAAAAAVHDPGISVVAPALHAAELGANALHDPTEGGLSAGLHELAEASGLAIQLGGEAVLWFEPGRALAAAMGADPWGTLASGALLAAFAPARTGPARTALEAAGYPVAVIGHALPGSGVARANGSALPRYDRDELSRLL